jgi:hypothetical protein
MMSRSLPAISAAIFAEDVKLSHEGVNNVLASAAPRLHEMTEPMSLARQASSGALLRA